MWTAPKKGNPSQTVHQVVSTEGIWLQPLFLSSPVTPFSYRLLALSLCRFRAFTVLLSSTSFYYCLVSHLVIVLFCCFFCFFSWVSIMKRLLGEWIETQRFSTKFHLVLWISKLNMLTFTLFQNFNHFCFVFAYDVVFLFFVENNPAVYTLFI